MANNSLNRSSAFGGYRFGNWRSGQLLFLICHPSLRQVSIRIAIRLTHPVRHPVNRPFWQSLANSKIDTNFPVILLLLSPDLSFNFSWKAKMCGKPIGSTYVLIL